MMPDASIVQTNQCFSSTDTDNLTFRSMFNIAQSCKQE